MMSVLYSESLPPQARRLEHLLYLVSCNHSNLYLVSCNCDSNLCLVSCNHSNLYLVSCNSDSNLYLYLTLTN